MSFLLNKFRRGVNTPHIEPDERTGFQDTLTELGFHLYGKGYNMADLLTQLQGQSLKMEVITRQSEVNVHVYNGDDVLPFSFSFKGCSAAEVFIRKYLEDCDE
jgi:hypothetical protein